MPPEVIKICGIPFAILGILSSIATFTSFLNQWRNPILLVFVTSLPLLYIIGLLTHNNTLTKRIEKINSKSKKIKKKLKRKSKAYRKLRSNRDGLVKQHYIDLNDKKVLQKQLAEKQIIITLLMQTIPAEELPDIPQKVKLLKELENLGTDDENSKNN